ncbi:glutamate ligase domain-containing protein [Salipaludibacillus neizhouensis]|uniref:glutamate ligase domain-containing protein n=1 Tax=Salipaludibacillus neizhouensis TaxID=885475 RepID=UPI001CBA5FFE|nr:cyanophycin synthetase [Salipaludibacillus neizhouensis]
MGFSHTEINTGLKKYRKLKRRLNIRRIRSGITIIDDSYSANPHAVKSAIDVLSHIGKGSNKVAVLGSMTRLGAYRVKGHKEVGKYIVERDIQHLYTYGKDAQWIKDSAIEYGFPKQNAYHFTDKRALHYHLLRKIASESQTTILIKGSNKMKMGKTVQLLIKHK